MPLRTAASRKRREGWAARPRVAHPDGAADTVALALPVLLVFGLAEVGQHILPTPACVAGVAPGVVVLGLAADVEQCR